MRSDADKAVIMACVKELLQERPRYAAVSLCRVTPRPSDLFSGTLFQTQGRLFIITCAHAVPVNLTNEVWVVRHSGSYRTKGYPRIIAVHRHPGGWPDIALLELSPEVLSTYLEGHRPLGADDLGSLEYTIPSHSVAILVGNAVEHARVEVVGEGHLVGASIRCLPHEVLAPADWPNPLSEEHPNDLGTDIYLRSVSDSAAEPAAAGFYYQLPHGLSGGGLWVVTYHRDQLTVPTDCKLVGVQAEWNKVAGCLRAARIERLPSI